VISKHAPIVLQSSTIYLVQKWDQTRFDPNLLLALVALVAGYLPARRAALLEPAQVLKTE